MNAHEWITDFAQRLGVDPPDQATFDTLLEIAGVAAHASERTAAPVACYLVGQVDASVQGALALAEELAGGE